MLPANSILPRRSVDESWLRYRIRPTRPIVGVLAHQQGRHEDAIELITRAISVNGNESTFFNNLGAAYRAVRKFTEAVVCFERVLELQPDDAAAHNNLAAVLSDQLRFDDAVSCILRALDLKPDFAEAHFNLGVARRNQGRLDEAAACFEHTLTFLPESAEVYYGLGIVRVDQGRLDDAIVCFQSALSKKPDDPEILNRLGVVLSAQGHLKQAVDCFVLALNLCPTHTGARNNLGNAQRDQGQLNDALDSYRRVLQCNPDDAEALNNLGVVLSDQGRLNDAVICYRRALQLRPDYAEAHCNLGTYHHQMGDFAGAEREYRDALQHDPNHVIGLADLASILLERMPAADVTSMQQAAENPLLTLSQRSLLHFRVAMVLDAQGKYSQAAAHLQQANSQSQAIHCRRGQGFDVAAHDRFVDELIDAFTPAHFERTRSFGVESEQPVFIFGLPRSGSTLTEQILSGHSQVYGAGELELAREAFESLPQFTKQAGSPVAAVGALDRTVCAELAAQHLDRLHGLDGFAVRVVDKLPDNYLYLGFLATLFPRAKLIHCRRDLRDTALSCWMTDFQRLCWTNQYEHIAGTFRAYERLMQHWRRVLPTPMLEVDYEQTVANVEATARRLVDWCGLSWEPQCVDFHLRRRPVQTASVFQVRQPIYRHAIGRWKHYEKFLAPLFALLPTEIMAGITDDDSTHRNSPKPVSHPLDRAA